MDDESVYGGLVYRLIPPDYPAGFGAIMDYGCEYVADELPNLGESSASVSSRTANRITRFEPR